ncbi:MAG: endonuclease domain-containing protein [Cyanobacteria bacterium J069]|nr:MAG: endonuclease domain-containing protein [Cyanobacteria bacterium J069]
MVKKTFNRIRGTTPDIEQAAKHLRKHQTPAEPRLWEALRNKKLHGLRFRRQHPVGKFIADFYCPSCKLVIELDGETHAHQADYDTARTQEMAAYGYHVIRFENQQIFDDLDSVLNVIYQKALSRSPPK